MKAFVALCLFIGISLGSSVPACVSVYPNTGCLSGEPTARPIITSNIECGVCYSSTVLQNSRNVPGDEIDNYAPEAYKELHSGFDFRVDCDTYSVEVYRALSKISARCYGDYVNHSTSDCIRLDESSVLASVGECEYSMRYGSSDYALPRDPICGYWANSGSASCGECNELYWTSENAGHSYYNISCETGLTTIYADSDCTEETTTVELSACHSFPTDGTGLYNLQILPTDVDNLWLCRVFWESNDCSGSTDYVDCDTACGGCYDSDVTMMSFPALGSYTNCDTHETTFYGDYFCSPDRVLNDPIPFNTCVQHDTGSLMVTYYLK